MSARDEAVQALDDLIIALQLPSAVGTAERRRFVDALIAAARAPESEHTRAVAERKSEPS